uniref:DUF221-domain-containing protein n=1 Tax=Mycena chlorophos TaxID=658473 RepID=A0ABQ0LZ78_MYCCL|nr:DUF221-domain-containing protein [Mycena chlorophos]
MAALNDTNLLIAENTQALQPDAVFSQMALMGAISAGTILTFNILRPKNKVIYEPKVKYHVGDKRPPRIDDSILGWLPPLLHTKEPELVDKVGLDAATFLRFGRMMRWLFTAIAGVSCGILIPINVIYNLRNVKSSARDILSMLTIRDVGGNLLFAHVAVSYIITFMIMAFVYMNWVQMVSLRRAWYRSPEYLSAFFARTLAVRHVPKSYQSDEGLKQIFDTVRVPYPTTSVHIGRKVGKLPELIEYHNQTVRELETYLVRYLKGGVLGKKRPTIRIGATCGCGGQKKDAIDFYTEKLKRTEAAIEDYRQHFHEHKPENYGFASMAAVPYAHVVAKILSHKHPKGTDIDLAPNPKDIIWENMSKSDAEIASKRMFGFLWIALVCFLNTAPLFIISILANLASLTSFVPFLKLWSKHSSRTFNLVSGILPSAVSGIFGFFLPIIIRRLSKYMGALTNSRLDRAVVARYFTFMVISQLIVFTLLGVIWQSVEQIVLEVGKDSFSEIIAHLHTLPATINRTYINQSSYWLTFFPLRGFLVLFDLAQIINVVWIYIKTRIFGRTPRDIREWTQPPEFQFAIYYTNLLFMASVGLIFAPLAPIVALSAAVVFWMSSIVQKYQLMFVYVSKVETGGRLWNVVVNRLLFIPILMQLLMALTIGLQYGWTTFTWVSTLPPILIIAIFKFYLSKTFDNAFRYYIPTPDELAAAKIHSERADAKANKLEKRFGHPALHADLFTPMLHSNQIGLLGQVYKGKIARDEAKLQEYGGAKMEAQVVEGIKIAAIEQRDLEFDPNLYRRNWSDADNWDTQSISSTTVFGDGSIKGSYYGDSVPRLAGYDQYLASGPGSPGGIEMARMDSINEPLLSARGGYFNASQSSIAPSLYGEPMVAGGSREAPLHRPQGSMSYSSESGFNQYPPNASHHGQDPSQYSQRSISPGPQRMMTPNPRSMSPGPQRMMTPNPQMQMQPQQMQQRSMSPGPQRMMTPNPQMQMQQMRSTSPGPQRMMTPNPNQSRSYSPGPNNMAGRGAYQAIGHFSTVYLDYCTAMANAGLGVPVKLLHESLGHIITVELKTGAMYRGKLAEAEDNLNISLKDITVTGRDGRVSQLDQVYIRGSMVRFFIVPDMLQNAPMFKRVGPNAMRGRGIGTARGRATIMRANARRGRGGPPPSRGIRR